jgi:hypothetical protein
MIARDDLSALGQPAGTDAGSGSPNGRMDEKPAALTVSERRRLNG